MKVLQLNISKIVLLTAVVVLSAFASANAQSSFQDSVNTSTAITMDIFPNPAQNTLSIQLADSDESGDMNHQNQDEFFQYSIGNVIGKKKKSGKIQKKPGSPVKIDVDISNLSPGVYFVVVTKANHSFTMKFIKK